MSLLIEASLCLLVLLTRCRFDGIDRRTTYRFCFYRSGRILSVSGNGWNCATRHHKIYSHSFASQFKYFLLAFRIRSSHSTKLEQPHQLQWIKIDLSIFCLKQNEEYNFSELLPSAYSLDILESIKGQILFPNVNSILTIKEITSNYINWKGYHPWIITNRDWLLFSWQFLLLSCSNSSCCVG